MLPPDKNYLHDEELAAEKFKAIKKLKHDLDFTLRSVYILVQMRDTGASLHIGIEPPTRGFSVRNFIA